MKERVDYLYKSYQGKGLVKYDSKDRFENNQKIGPWIYREEEQIKKLAKNGNESLL